MTVAAFLLSCVIISPVTLENLFVNCETVGPRLQESRHVPTVLELTQASLSLHFSFTMFQNVTLMKNQLKQAKRKTQA